MGLSTKEQMHLQRALASRLFLVEENGEGASFGFDVRIETESGLAAAVHVEASLAIGAQNERAIESQLAEQRHLRVANGEMRLRK
jgi:hypothetical protein